MSDPTSARIIEVSFSSLEELEKIYREGISKGGYFHPADDPAPRTTPVELRFRLPGLKGPLAVKGEVAFAATSETPMPGMGIGMAIQFQDLSPAIKSAFETAITIAQAEGFDQQSTAPEAGPDPEADEKDEEEEEEEKDEDEAGDSDSASPKVDQTSDRQIMARLNMLTSENLYSALRQLPLHHKIAAAKRGNRSVRNILMQEGKKKILTYLLQNPQLGPGEVIQMLKMPNLSLEIIQLISKNTQWNQNEEIRYLITIHPKTPLPLALNLLTGLNVNNLAKIAKANYKAQIKSNAVKLLELRRKST